ncbi:MAG: hypothetical protein PVG03_01555 [Desulfarculaceae bacterium]|jgi:hypothetical protein
MARKQTNPPAQPPVVDRLSPRQEALLKASKEIAVKFIETGRLSVASFAENFPQIYQAIEKTLKKDD